MQARMAFVAETDAAAGAALALRGECRMADLPALVRALGAVRDAESQQIVIDLDATSEEFDIGPAWLLRAALDEAARSQVRPGVDRRQPARGTSRSSTSLRKPIKRARRRAGAAGRWLIALRPRDRHPDR